MRVVSGDSNTKNMKKFVKTPKNKSDLNQTHIDIMPTSNDFIPPVLYLRGRGGNTVASSPHQNKITEIQSIKFKKKNE
jgi:hypothetical protein